MKKLLFSMMMAALGTAAQAQVQFGPYLTYSGTARTMTIQVAVSSSDTRTYYVKCWKNGGSVSTVTMNISKTLDCTYLQGWCESYDNCTWNCTHDGVDPRCAKFKTWSVKLTGLTMGARYNYVVTDNMDESCGGSFKECVDSIITASTFNASSGQKLVLNKPATLSGSFSGVSGELVSVENTSYVNLGVSSYATPGVIFSHLPSYGNFVVPDTGATSFSCFLVSDTQNDGTPYYPNMLSLQLNNQGSCMPLVIHAGDFQSDPNSSRELLVKYPSLFSRMVLQVVEGNHDTQYEGIYNPDAIVESDDLCSFSGKKYTRAMIPFDKFFHYDYPGLASTVTVMKNGASTAIEDLYSHYYSFDCGPAHFCMLDYDNLYKYANTKDTGYVGKQLRWLWNDLSATRKKFKVIVVHAFEERSGGSRNYSITFKPVFNNTTTTGTTEQILDSIVSKKKVAVVINGHWAEDGATSIEKSGSKNYYYIQVPNEHPPTTSAYYKAYYALNFNSVDSIFSFQRYSQTNQVTLDVRCKLDNDSTIILKR